MKLSYTCGTLMKNTISCSRNPVRAEFNRGLERFFEDF